MKTGTRNLIKKTSWKEDLFTYVESVRERPFRWGTFDCCVFAFQCVKAMTGVDPMLEVGLKNLYRSEAKAKELMGSSLAGLVDGHLDGFSGVKEVVEGKATSGDIAALRGQENEIMAVCINGSWLAPEEKGLHRIEKPQFIKIWRLG